MEGEFVKSLSKLTDAVRADRGDVSQHYKFFRQEGAENAVVCKWDEKQRTWKKFGEVPPQSLTPAKAKQIVSALTAKDARAVQAARAVSPEEAKAALQNLAKFEESFRDVNREEFVFRPEHTDQLSKAEVATEVLRTCSKGSPTVLFAFLFANPVPPTPAARAMHPLSMLARLIDVLTLGIENTVRVDKSKYSSETLLKTAKVRLQLLQAVQYVASNESATMVLAALSSISHNSAPNGDEATIVKSTVGKAQDACDFVGTIVNILHCASAKFDFVAVQVATNLLRNWALCRDANFRRALITKHHAMAAVIKLFGHKDENVAGTAIATMRHMCLDSEGSALQSMTEDDIAAIEAFSQNDPALVFPVVRVEFGRCICALVCQANEFQKKASVTSEEVSRLLAEIPQRLSTPACLFSVVFLLAGPHHILYNEVMGMFKALNWMHDDGSHEPKLDELEMKIDGTVIPVLDRMKSLGLIGDAERSPALSSNVTSSIESGAAKGPK